MLSSIWNDFLQFAENSGAVNNMVLSGLKGAKVVEMQEDKITLSCESQGARLFLQMRLRDIEAGLSSFLQRQTTVVLVVEEKKNKKVTDAPLLTFEPTSDDMAARAGLNRKYTFDNFAVSTTNQVAFAAAQNVAKSPGENYNPLFLYGGVGNGKTHLAQATARTILEKDPDKRVLFSPGDQFINELIEAIREKNTAKFRKKYRPVQVLIVDDIQFIAGKRTVQEEFFHTFNTIVSAGGQVILTSDKPPTDIKDLEDRLRSRFSQGLIVDIQAPDFELRAAIVMIKAEEKNIMVDMMAAQMIAEKITDTRALEGTLLSIYAKIVGQKELIDLDSVEAHFAGASMSEMVTKKISPLEVVKTVCAYFDVKQAHIKSPSRASSIVLPRQIIMYLLRNELKMKLEEIAYTLKRKDHTTVMHGVEKIEHAVLHDAVMKGDIDKIVQSLRSST
jgi:chromosomal replication initiator protein